MSVSNRIKELVAGTTVSEWFDALASNDSGIIFFKDGSIGALLIGETSAGIDDKSYSAFKQILMDTYPSGTVLQFIQANYPDLDEPITEYEVPREAGSLPSQVALELAKRRMEFVRAGETEAPIPRQNTLLMRSKNWITVRIPTKGVPFPEDQEIKEFQETVAKLLGSLQTGGVYCRVANGRSEFLSVIRRCFDMYGRNDDGYDDGEMLHKQFVPAGTRVTVQLKTVRLPNPKGRGRTYAKSLCVRRFPKQMTLGHMNFLGGSPDGIGVQIGVPHLISTTIHIPDQNSKLSSVRSKAAMINQQAYGPMLKWAPILVAKKEGFDTLGLALDEGDAVVEATTTLTLFHPHRRTLEKLAARARSMLSVIKMEMSEERFITWPTLLNSFPLGATPQSIRGTRRFKTLGARHAACLMPVMGDWAGYGAAIMLQTRRGKPFFYDFFHKQFNANYSWMLVAEAGAGKSFAVQRIIQDYLSLGTQMWVIDKGESHIKTTRVLGGQYIEFSLDSKICLNPFTHVEDIDEDIGMLTALLAKMCRPTSKIEDDESPFLMEAIKSSWAANGNAMTIDHIWRYLLDQKEQAIPNMLGRMLYPFTSQGPYGSWFVGRNNLDMHAPLVTLELKHLESQPVLQQVVLLQLIVSVQQAMYRGDDNQKKMMIVEECADLLEDHGFSRFLSEAYSKVRKHRGSMGIVLQNLAQLYRSPYGGQISASASTMLIMEQKNETIETAKKNGWIDMSDGAFELLKSVHTIKGAGGYSEIFFRTPGGSGIARLVESRFNQVLYSTEGRERTEIMQAMERGMPPLQAIQNYIDEHG